MDNDWFVASLHYDAHDPREFDPEDQPSDSQLAEADAIVVSTYDTDMGDFIYRTVHGADDYEQLEDLIDDMEGSYF